MKNFAVMTLDLVTLSLQAASACTGEKGNAAGKPGVLMIIAGEIFFEDLS